MKKNNKKKGSATILLILIVLTVVLFGVLNMMSVFTSFKISKKNLDWTNDYYKLDKQANVFVNQIKKSVVKGINSATLLTNIENMKENKEVLINGQEITFPISKDSDIIQADNINIQTYFLNDSGERQFYINFDIASNSENPIRIQSWRRVNQEFEYKIPEFMQGEEMTIVEN